MCPPCARSQQVARQPRPAIPINSDRCRMRKRSSFLATGAAHGYCGHSPRRSFPVGFRQRMETPENAAKYRHKSCPAWKKRRAASSRPAIIARPCNDRVATQEPEQMDITPLLRSDRCRVVLPKSSKSPGNSSKRSRTRKKFAGWDPSRAKSPGKQRFSAFKTGQRCTHLGSKRWQMGAKNA